MQLQHIAIYNDKSRKEFFNLIVMWPMSFQRRKKKKTKHGLFYCKNGFATLHVSPSYSRDTSRPKAFDFSQSKRTSTLFRVLKHMDR